MEERAQRGGESAPQRVVITGGASGIGRATAVLMAGRGARVAILDVDDAAGEDLARASRPSGGSISYLHADVSRAPEVASAMQEAAAHLGGIDVLVTAAGIMRGQMQDIRDHDEETWDRVIDVNLKGSFLAARYAAPHMLEQGRGVILLVASKAGVSTGSGSFSYGASKGGMHGLALTLDRHLGPRGIRVIDVCPGDVDTPLFRHSIQEGVARGADPEAARELLSRLTPPESIAEVLAFLASDKAAAVRGTVFTA